MGPLTQRSGQPILGCPRPTYQTTRGGWIQAAYLEVIIGGLLGYTTIVVQIKRLANLNQILLLIFCFVCFLLWASGMEDKLDKYTTHEKRRPLPLGVTLPHQRWTYGLFGPGRPFVIQDVKKTNHLYLKF